MISATSPSHTLDTTLLTKYCQQQLEEQFQRIVDGNYELVDYKPNSSIRFWVNNLSTNYATHWHSEMEIIMPLESCYDVTFGQQDFHLLPGDILIIPSGELHQLTAPPSGTRLICLFSSSTLSKIRSFSYLTPYISSPILINRNNYEEIYDKAANLMIQMCHEYFSENLFSELTVFSHLLDLFACYGQYRVEYKDTLNTLIDTNRHKILVERLNKVFSYLDEHFMEDITLEDAADIAGFSKYYFTRLFKQCSGYTFYNYLNFRRIKSAEDLLLNPNLSITEIALQSGFSSLSTFNRTFRKIKNCSPTEYRNLYNLSSHCRQ